MTRSRETRGNQQRSGEQDEPLAANGPARGEDQETQAWRGHGDAPRDRRGECEAPRLQAQKVIRRAAVQRATARAQHCQAGNSPEHGEPGEGPAKRRLKIGLHRQQGEEQRQASGEQQAAVPERPRSHSGCAP